VGKYSDISDNELIRKVAKYDSRALEELYDRYAPLLYTIIKKIVPDETTAENILLEVFTIIWRKIDKYDFKADSPYTWLVTLARNRAVDTLRRTRSAAETTYYNDEYEDYFILPLLSPEIDSLDLETARKIMPAMEKALARLTDTQKYVIHLAYYEGYTIKEISKKLNIPIETVRQKIMTAVINLKDNLLAS
jgi:RNA polymerase sigma-70 factor (ECF subfamily)